MIERQLVFRRGGAASVAFDELVSIELGPVAIRGTCGLFKIRIHDAIDKLALGERCVQCVGDWESKAKNSPGLTSASGRKRPVKSLCFPRSERPLWVKADVQIVPLRIAKAR